ncbi:hypothetical protein Q7P35_004583 [Cladosporium inversicolor]
MPPVQGSGKAPNIANPNMPTAPSKASSVVGSVAASESPAAIAKDDPVKAIEKLETRTKAINANNVARVANSHLTSNDAKLHPLVSLRTGNTLDKFPQTSKDIAKLTLLQVDNMLLGLDADRAGNEAAKREKLRLQIGLKPNPA